MNNLEIIPPKTRKEMEHNIALVFEHGLDKTRSGSEMSIGSFAHFTLPHLQSLQFLPNGRVVLSSVNESLRSQANMLHNLQFMSGPKLIKDENNIDSNQGDN